MNTISFKFNFTKILLATAILVFLLCSNFIGLVLAETPDQNTINANIPSSTKYTLDLVLPHSKASDSYLIDSENELTAQANSISPITILGYHNLSEVEARLHYIAQTYPSIAKVFDLGVLFPHPNGTPKRTVQNRSLWALKISDNPGVNESNEPEVLYMGLHHAREWITVEAVLYFTNYIINNYQTNTTIGNIVNNTELWIIPVVNPDGFHYSQYVRDDINNTNSNQWRKNCNESNGLAGFQDYDWARGDGVDLNRNYGYQWGYDDTGSSPDPVNQLYRGTAAFSEVETQIIRDLALAREFSLAISFHSYSQWIIFPYAYDYYDTPHDALFSEIAKNMSQYNNYAYGNIKDGIAYPCNGETTDWLYYNRTCLGFTFELGTVFIPPTAQILPICQKNLEPSILIAKIANDPYQIFKSGVRGRITTTLGEPLSGVNVTATYANEPFWRITNSTGHYQLRLPPGSYTLSAVKPGYSQKWIGVGILQDVFSITDFSMVDVVPPVVSAVWANVSTEAEETFIIGSMVRINVEEQYHETNLNGTVEITSASQNYSSSKQPLEYDNFNGRYYWLWDTYGLAQASDYMVETTLEDYDLNIDENGSNDLGPDLIIILLDKTAPIISMVDTKVIGPGIDTDEHYEVGSTVSVLVFEQFNEKWLNGSVNITSTTTGYDSGTQQLVFDSANNVYSWSWSTEGLTPSDDYAIETELWDQWGNIDNDGLGTFPDIYVTLVDTTPPVIKTADSAVNLDNDETYEIGSEVVISFEVFQFEPGLTGVVNISSVSTGYQILIDNVMYDTTKSHFYVLWNTTGREIADDYIVEIKMADKYLNYDSDGSNNSGPDLIINLQDNIAPTISQVYSFVGIDQDNNYERGAVVWIVVIEARAELNLVGSININSPSLGYSFESHELSYDDELNGYVLQWTTSSLDPAPDYQIETTLSDKYGNQDSDGLPIEPDLTIALEDNIPPEIISVWSRVGADTNNNYECGSVVEIIVEERLAEAGLSGTIHIKSMKIGYDSGVQDLVWDNIENYYTYKWPTEAIVPSDDYSIETTLRDKWKNIDSDGLPASPDLIITLVDTTPPDHVTNLTTHKDPELPTKIILTWNTSEPDVSVLIYRSIEPIYNITGLDPIANVTGNNFTDTLPSEPGTYYYLLLEKDAAGNINSTIDSSNTAKVVLPDPNAEPYADINGDDLALAMIFLLIIIIIIFSISILLYSNKMTKAPETQEETEPDEEPAADERVDFDEELAADEGVDFDEETETGEEIEFEEDTEGDFEWEVDEEAETGEVIEFDEEIEDDESM